MPKVLKLIILILILSTFANAQNKTIKITYISSQNVYINGGKAEGISISDTLKVMRDDRYIGTIQVDYVATHSASCHILHKRANLKKNDIIKISFQHSAQPVSSAVKKSKIKPKTEKLFKQNAVQIGKTVNTRVQGYFSLQYYHFSDGSGKGNNFSQPTLRFRMRIDDFFKEGFHFEINYRTRYNQRQRKLGGDIPKTEWQNRFYQFNFSYRLAASPLQFYLGRVISNALSGVGYIDGALIQWQMKRNWFIGGFGGTQPNWRTSNWQTEIQKYGVYARFVQGSFGANREAFTIAASGEYHGTTVSREFLFFRGSYNHGRRWNIYQQTELDINRNWRKERMGHLVSLTGLYVNGRYNFNKDISLSLGYDNRKNYYSYETRTIADSLFDTAVRQGIRFSGFARLFNNYRLAIYFGIRDRQTDARFSYNYGFNLNKRRFLGLGNALFLNVSGFDNLFANGINPLLRLSHRFDSRYYLSLIYGGYYYKFKDNTAHRLDQWLRLNTQADLPRRMYASFSYQYDWGNDIPGQRIFFEFGYRF